MKKTLIALTAATALAAGTVAVPGSANAYAWWVIPAIVAAGVGGVAVGAAAQQNTVYQGGPRGSVYVQPSGVGCRIVDQQSPSGRWRHVRVCD